jgi:glycosyltransferase involved in cell wall biosynthesis
MQRRQVALFLPSLAGGGAERMMLNLAGGLYAAGERVDLVLAQRFGEYVDEVPEGVRVVDLGAKRVLGAVPSLARYLGRERPRSILSALDHANIAAILARRMAASPSRLFVSVHNTLSVEAQRSHRLRDHMLPMLARRFYPGASAVVAVSRGVAEDLVQRVGIPRGRVKVIYNAVVTPELQRQATQSSGHPWLAEGQPPVILAAGRLIPSKGFATLIDAFARARQGCAARLLILGEGPERARLESLARGSTARADIALPGFVSNPFSYMREAGLFVLASTSEGLPAVLIEALACGTPVVSTDCRSGPAEILDNGRHGTLVPVGDVEALASAMVAALERPKDPGLLRARADEFALPAITNQYLALMSSPS